LICQGLEGILLLQILMIAQDLIILNKADMVTQECSLMVLLMLGYLSLTW
jgi:hypothetical protein